MKKEYIVPIIMALLLIVFIVLMTISATNGITVGGLSVLSVSGMKLKKTNLQIEKTLYETKEKILIAAQASLKSETENYEMAKKAYEAMDEAKIDAVEEAQKEQKFYIDWLWIEIGNYASANNLKLSIEEPKNSNFSSGQSTGTITVSVTGTYSNIADFVFEIENDNDLRFKLDNMSMVYAGNNNVTASFEVLNMEVAFKE